MKYLKNIIGLVDWGRFVYFDPVVPHTPQSERNDEPYRPSSRPRNFSREMQMLQTEGPRAMQQLFGTMRGVLEGMQNARERGTQPDFNALNNPQSPEQLGRNIGSMFEGFRKAMTGMARNMNTPENRQAISKIGRGVRREGRQFREQMHGIGEEFKRSMQPLRDEMRGIRRGVESSEIRKERFLGKVSDKLANLPAIDWTDSDGPFELGRNGEILVDIDNDYRDSVIFSVGELSQGDIKYLGFQNLQELVTDLNDQKNLDELKRQVKIKKSNRR